MHKATTPTLIVLALLLAPTAAADTLTATLDTAQPADIHGTASIHDANGLTATWSQDATITLQAETLHLTTHRYEGETIPYPQSDDDALRLETNHEQDTTTLHEATLTATPWKTPLQLVAEPNPDTTITGQSTQIATLTATDDRTLAWEGIQDPHSATNDGAYHQSKVQTPTALLQGANHANATGDLDLFINNATLQAHAQNGDTWQGWTGHRTNQTGTTQTYQIHITTLQATNATLTLHDPSTLTLLGDALTLHTNASIHLDHVEGTLTLPNQDTQNLHDDALTLHGAATTHAHPENGETLRLETTGELEILHTTNANLQPHQAPPNESSLAWILLPLALLAIVAAIPIQQPGLLKDLPNHKTEWLYRYWRDKGLDHEGREEYDKATNAYRKLTKLRPSNPLPWYFLARTHLNAGDPEATLETIHDAEENADFIPRDIHEVHILALWDADKHDEIPAALDRIAQTNAETALHIAHDFDLHDLLSDHDEAWWTNAQPARGQGIDGYT